MDERKPSADSSAGPAARAEARASGYLPFVHYLLLQLLVPAVALALIYYYRHMLVKEHEMHDERARALERSTVTAKATIRRRQTFTGEPSPSAQRESMFWVRAGEARLRAGEWEVAAAYFDYARKLWADNSYVYRGLAAAFGIAPRVDTMCSIDASEIPDSLAKELAEVFGESDLRDLPPVDGSESEKRMGMYKQRWTERSEPPDYAEFSDWWLKNRPKPLKQWIGFPGNSHNQPKNSDAHPKK